MGGFGWDRLWIVEGHSQLRAETAADGSSVVKEEAMALDCEQRI